MGGSRGKHLSPVPTHPAECLPRSIFLSLLSKPILRAVQLFVPIELVIPLLGVYCKEINSLGRRESYINKISCSWCSSKFDGSSVSNSRTMGQDSWWAVSKSWEGHRKLFFIIQESKMHLSCGLQICI